MRIPRALRRWLMVIGVALILAAVVAGFVWFRKGRPVEPAVPPVWMGGTVELHEGDPGWYCGTHGNRVCGLSWRAV